MTKAKSALLLPPATTLKDAGTQASSRTLTVANSQAYGDIESSLPDNWKAGQGTIQYAK